MITSVTVYEVECDGCGNEIYPPRAQDYWESRDLIEREADSCDWTLNGDYALCWRCTEAAA